MPNTKTIASAIQKGTNVYAYNEKGIYPIKVCYEI